MVRCIQNDDISKGRVPLDDVLLLLNGLPQRIPQGNLSKVLQRRIDGVTDGVVEHALHASHQHLQAFDHGHHLLKAEHLIRDSPSLYRGGSFVMGRTSTKANFSSLV